jgi:uncharacterized protein (TIGR02391 family)
MTNKIRLAIVLSITGVSLIAGLYYGVLARSMWLGIFVFAIGIFFGALFIAMPLFLIMAMRDEHNTIDKLLNVLLNQIRRHPDIALWPTGIAAVAFFSLSTVWGIAIYQVPPQDAIRLVQNSLGYEIAFFVLMFLGIVFLLLSRIPAKPSLFSSLAKNITPELIVQNPQAAIEHSFTYLEDYLRNRTRTGSELTGEGLSNAAFGQNGKLTYGATENEDRGIRNLMLGAFATFRNPRKHRIMKDDEHTVLAIITLVDLLVQFIDKSKDRSTAP